MPTFSHYVLTELLRDSTYTTVYRARHRSDNTPVILKRLKQDYPTPETIARLKREYEITQRLSEHIKGVAQVLALEKHNNTWFIVLADEGGQSLAQVLLEHAFDLTTFLPIALSLATTIGQIHQHNIIHKDINPANLIWHPETQHVKIIDFGIASVLSRENPTLIHVNQLEGTLPYISPEQTGRMNRAVDYRSDFYSLGVTFYQLLTQQLPFATDDTLELIHAHLAKMPRPPHELNTTIPPLVSEIILKLMAKMAEDRYQSASGLQTDLQTCLTQLTQQGYISEFPLGQADVSDKFQLPQKLYGREAETQVYLEAFEQVSQGMSQWMLIAGYSGIGKSALVHEIYKPITQKQGYFITGKFDQFQRNVPYSALVQAFADLVRQLLMESEQQLCTWKQQLLKALGPNGQVIIEVIPEIEWIIGHQPEIPALGATEAQNRFNLVFQNFVQVFCQPQHPLVLFLDDLQWVDSATLKLIELLLTQQQLGYLFLIGAYRDNEVNPTHPLIMMLETLQQQQVIIKQIALGPLTLTQSMQLLADTLHREQLEALADLVMRKTGGNPFFINQFLKTLYDEGLITFDFELSGWRWDIAHIEAMNITDNVVELMVNKLKKLSQATQEVLQLAACIGNQFDLKTLSWINEKTVLATLDDLIPALEEGLILLIQGQLSEISEQLSLQQQASIRFKFLHDRVQQAAYSLIAADQKQAVHLQIGQLLLANLSEAEQEENIFEIVDHLNVGSALIHLASEREQLAQLNLISGKKAKISSAYDAALSYLQKGIELLEPECWQVQYELTWTLHIEVAEVLFLQVNFEYMEEILDIVLQQTEVFLYKVKVYEIQIAAYNAKNQFKEAINTGKQILKQLGVKLPNKPNYLHFLYELMKFKFRLRGKQIENLWCLPETTDSRQLAIARIIRKTFAPIYNSSPELLPSMIFKQVNLSLKYGNTRESIFAYVLCGTIFCSKVNNIEIGYQLGQLALRLLEHFDAREHKSLIFHLYNNFILHWKRHINEAPVLLREAYQSGLETGDLEFASYSALSYSIISFFSGRNLKELEQEVRVYNKAITKTKQQSAINQHEMYCQTILNLRGYVSKPYCLTGEFYDEEKRLSLLIQTNNRSTSCYHYTNKLILCYLFCEYSQAMENANKAERLVYAVQGLTIMPIFHFYNSLVRLIVFSGSSKIEQKKILKKVATNQKKIKKWAHHAPMNFLHKYYLVEAERHRVLGHTAKAADLYDQAIQLAKDNEYLNEEALAYELAGRFYLSQNKPRIAQIYLRDAHYAYTQWGAIAKVNDLETRYPEIFAQLRDPTAAPATTTLPHTTTNQGEVLDLNAVMKASRAIASEIYFDDLLKTLTTLIIENAGAQRGFLLLEQDGQWLIQPSQEERAVAQSLIHYVARSQDTVILDNASEENQFTQDPHILAHHPKSILCVPLINQNRLIGIIYLENNLSTHVFTPQRVETVHLLGAQAAISLENAKLYADLAEYNRTLETKVKQRTQELSETLEHLKTTQQELIQSEKMAALGQLIAGIAHEVNTPIGAIRASIGNIIDALKHSLAQLPQLLQQLTPEQQERFFALIHKTFEPRPQLTSREERKHKRALIQELETYELEHAEDIADTLVDMGVYKHIASFAALLKMPNSTTTLKIAYEFSTLQVNSQNIELAVDRASKIVFALKSYAHQDSSGQKVKARLVDGLQVVLTLYHNQLKNNITLLTHYQQLPAMLCYPDELNQVWTNLIHNALQAMNNQGTLEINVFQEGQQAVVQITDSGCGIAPEIQKRIFEPFFTTKGAGEGSGLGLDIVRKIIQKHQGTIDVDSQPGKTSFRVSLPIIE